MILGLNDNLKRIRPMKGLSARCELCNELLIPACGDVYIHHWRHQKSTECDPWKENETDWHRNWKSQFPEDWMEIVIKGESEVHRADIKTESGLVLELQNASISRRDIQEREKFYRNMIWLINAQNFGQNFSFRDVVAENLQSLEENVHSLLSLNNDIEEDLDSYYQIKNKHTEELHEIESEVTDLFKKEDDLINIKDSLEKYAVELYGTFKNSFGYQTSIFDKFECENLASIQKITKRLSEINREVDEIDKKIKLIDELPDCSIESLSHFKVVPFKMVALSSYAKCKVVKNDTINTIFPEIHDLNSESNFKWYSKQEGKYTLVINPTSDMSLSISRKNQFEEEKKGLLITEKEEYNSLLNAMGVYINKNIEDIRTNIENLKIGIENKTMEINEINKDIANERERLRNESIEYCRRIRAEKEKKRFSIMKDNKELYYYEWKYRRPSWKIAKAPIFFDFGDHIFQIINDEKMKKISVSEFVKFVMKWPEKNLT